MYKWRKRKERGHPITLLSPLQPFTFSKIKSSPVAGAELGAMQQRKRVEAGRGVDSWTDANHVAVHIEYHLLLFSFGFIAPSCWVKQNGA